MSSIDYIKLGEVATAKGGSGFPEIYQGGDTGIPFIKVSDMNLLGNERFITRSNNYLEQHLINRLNISVFPRDSIVFAKVGAALLLNRRRLLASETAIDNNMMAVMCHGIDVGFLYHYLTSVDFEIFVQPGAVPSINQKHIHDLDIPKFTLDEQQKIAEILTSTDEQIEATEKLIEKKRLIKLSLTDEAIGLAKIIGRYEIMSDYCQSVADGTHDTPAPLDEGVPLLTSKNLSEDGRLDLNDFYYISEKQSLEINKRSYVNQGDLLFGMIGTIGNPVICRDSVNFSVKNVAILRQGGDLLRSKWLFYTLNSSQVKRNIDSMLDGSTQKFLSLSKIRALPIPMLEKSEMNSWVNILDAIHDEIMFEGQFLEKLKLQKQGLMQDLLTGRVRVN